MNSVRIDIANPDTFVRKTLDGVIWSSVSIDSVLQVGLSLERVWATAMKDLDDGVLIAVRLVNGTADEVRAFRAAASSYEIFFVQDDDGGLLLSDQFSCALAAVPVEQRRICRQSLADHLLFRTVPGSHTYVRAVQRLAHGEELVWRPGWRGVRRRTQQSLVPPKSPPSEQWLDAVDGVLNAAIAPLARLTGIENMLSGGVDSTLVHTYLGASVPSVSGALTSDEFRFEVDYALSASKLLGVQHRLASFDESTYLTELETCIDGIGVPPHHLQTVLLDAVFRSGGQRFITAQFADALFGISTAAFASRVRRLHWLLRLIPEKGAWFQTIALAAPTRFHAALEVSRQLDKPPTHPQGFASTFARYTDISKVAEIVGKDVTAERLEARLLYVNNRIPLTGSPKDSMARHLELGHFVSFFCDDALSLWRQAAQSRGKSLYAPFTSRRLVETVLSIPSPTRYLQDGRYKHLLKDLLGRRLPSYPVDQRKGSSGLPLRRFFTSGPLRTAGNDCRVPSFIEPQHWKSIFAQQGWLAWNMLTLALWEDRVLRRPPSLARLQSCHQHTSYQAAQPGH